MLVPVCLLAFVFVNFLYITIKELKKVIDDLKNNNKKGDLKK